MTMTTTKTAREIGRTVGQAIARDVMADADMTLEWTGLEAQDGDQLAAAGFATGTQEWADAEEAAEEAYHEIVTLVCGNQVQHDNSSVGHNWRPVAARDIPADIRAEIEGEIIDGGKDECEKFIGSNGLHYRW